MPRVLLCPPDYYGIEYEINPWMSRSRNADTATAGTQWRRLRDTLKEIGFEIELILPEPRLPDMVFTANAGLVIGDRFIESNFRFSQRRRESAHFERWFCGHGYEIVQLPNALFFEGEGDALFCGDTLFCGYRFRSDIRSHRHLGEWLGCLVVSVELVDERFYHLDTCFCPLPDGKAVWYPGAIDEYGRRAIRQHVKQLIEVGPEEACRFACNAIVEGGHIILPQGCPRLSAALSAEGYRIHGLPMSEFIKAGGACKCLSLFLPQREAVVAGTEAAVSLHQTDSYGGSG